MLEPAKIAFGHFLGRFFSALTPTTKSLGNFVNRPVDRAIVWAPSRMVDAAEDMLSLWMRADIDGTPTKPPDLPIIIVAMAKDYTPTGRDYTRQVADNVMISLPSDPKGRVFGLRTVAGDVRAQLAIFATDEPSARSLAAQFLLFMDGTVNRRFDANYQFAGIDMAWPVQIDSPESPAMSISTGAKNLTVLALDITLHVTVPLFDAPAPGQPNDGKGVPGTDDPAGYPMVSSINVDHLIREYQIDSNTRACKKKGGWANGE